MSDRIEIYGVPLDLGANQRGVDMGPSALRIAGISPQKLRYLRSLTDHIQDHRLDLALLPDLPDAEVVQALTDVKGIGEWTAHMFLIFSLGRLNVLPTGDLGVKKGMHIVYDLDALPKPKEMQQLADAREWPPFCTVASWYMWRALENAG